MGQVLPLIRYKVRPRVRVVTHWLYLEGRPLLSVRLPEDASRKDVRAAALRFVSLVPNLWDDPQKLRSDILRAYDVRTCEPAT